MSKWKKLSSKYVYENPWTKVREDEVVMADGKKGIFSIVEQDPGAEAIPVNDDGRIWMIRNYRYVFDDARWQFPCGGIEKGETAEEGARRELCEELEMNAREMIEIGQFRPSTGRTDHFSYVFIARGLKPAPQKVRDFDVLEKKLFSLDEIDEMIRNGEILDGYVMNALYFYKLYLEKGFPSPGDPPAGLSADKAGEAGERD